MDFAHAVMRFLLSVTFFEMIGCAQPSKYYWGDYQELIYDEYTHPDKAMPERQIEKLEAGIHEAKSKSKPLAPGYYAHLGYQYLKAGRGDGARMGFENEMRNFPESAPLMQRFLKKIK